jgi:hypothetical protein
MVLNNPQETRKLQAYKNVQDRYIKWALARGVDPMKPNPPQLLNWLAAGVTISDWSPGTVENYRAAIIYMYDDKSSFRDADFQSFFKAIRARHVREVKELNIDIQPALDHLRNQGPNKDLSMSALTKKLCWLLGICGFMRPSDIEYINLAHKKFELTESQCVLPVVRPKETRNGQPIHKCITIKCHDDPLLCPVQTMTEYLHRIHDHKIMVPHPKNKTELYRPLIRDVRFPKKPVGNDTISNHIASITELLSLPENAKARAIGPTEAIKKGARVDDVVVHGNWSSSIIFDRFYRLTSASAVNFTSLVLS